MSKSGKGYIVEFSQVGTVVRCSAVDPKTNVEVSTVGSVNHSREYMTNVAVRKLEYRLEKLRQENKRR